MSKSSNNSNVVTLYEEVLDSLKEGVAEGYDLEEVLSLPVNERDQFFNYGIVDSHFDGKGIPLEKKMKNCSIPQKYALYHYGRLIARKYLKDNDLTGPEFKTYDEERQLEILFLFGQRRGVLDDASHYLDRGQALVGMVKTMVNGYLVTFADSIKESATGLSATLRSEECSKANKITMAGQKVLLNYPKNHGLYSSAIKG